MHYSLVTFLFIVPSSGTIWTREDAHRHGYTRSDIIYGHLHIAKTGGTSLNGILANRFERVCGHKGYSYDAYLANERAKLIADAANADSIETITSDWSSDKVQFSFMHEIGYEDCDYISTEEENP